MIETIDSLEQSIDQDKDTIAILVGESGAGKSTFCNFVDLPNITYTSSEAIIEEVAGMGLPSTHENIHRIANEKYTDDPGWQIPNILARLAISGVLILDGPRRINEVELLREQPINTPIIRISSSENHRMHRLENRDEVDENEFIQIVHDEANETELDKILDLADINILNDTDLNNLQSHALALRSLIKKLERRT